MSLGNLAVSVFVKDQREIVRSPLELVLCENCSLVQLREQVNQDLLFKHFWYQSRISSSMQNSLKEIADNIKARGILRKGDWVIDIGCNDGTFLQMLPDNNHKIGYEPAENVAQLADKTGKIYHEYFNAASYHPDNGRPRLITAIAMFYDVPDPARFCKDVAELLQPDGTFLIQMNYLLAMLLQNSFDNICHEHLGYYSLQSLSTVLARAGLEIYDAELNEVNGGSIRVYAGFKDAHQITGRVANLQGIEKQAGLSDISTYKSFKSRIDENGKHLRGFLEDEKKEGKKTWIMGASTRGNTLLQYYRIDHRLVEGAVDKNREKWGLRTAGTDIPIWSRTEAVNADNFLVLPYHFIDEFKEQEKQFLANGGRLIVPLPKFRVI